MKKGKVILLKAETSSLEDFKRELQESFRVAAEADFGHPLEEPIPSDKDIDQSFSDVGAATYWIVADGQRVGGAVLAIDDATGHNALSFFFISTSQQSRGLGLSAWQAIESAYPNTKVWETVTPYFEKRNIHFYVNRCGFKIVEFYSKYHPDPNESHSFAHEGADDSGMFRFEKVMK